MNRWFLTVFILLIAFFYFRDLQNHEGYDCFTMSSANISENFKSFAKDFKSQCIKLSKSNISLHVLDNRNTEAKETIMFVHGLTFSTYMWKESALYFKDKFRVILFDHRGQGFSELDAGFDPITTEINFKDAMELIEVLQKKENIGKVHFVGHSMGGFVGMRIAARNPELLKSVILVNTDAEVDKNNKNLQNEIFTFVARYFGFVRSIMGPALLPTFFSKSYLENPENAEHWQDYWIAHVKPTSWRAIRGILDRTSFTELDKIKVPTLVIHGEGDISIPPQHAKKMAEDITGAKYVSIPQAGHQAPSEKPKEMNEAILDFIKGITK